MEGHAREMAFLQLKLHEKTQDEQGFDSLMSEQATHHSVATLEFCFENWPSWQGSPRASKAGPCKGRLWPLTCRALFG